MRSAESLDGSWQARLDPLDVGVVEGWYQPQAPFDRELAVPLAWQAADPELRTYAGVVWYRRVFRLPTSWRDQSIAVRFGAVDYDAKVWLNGHEVGGHIGGYTPFELDLTPRLDWRADNCLVVRVFDPADVDDIPHGKQGGRWYTPVSGPWQSVSMLCRPRRRINRLRCVPDVHTGTFRLRLDCLLDERANYRVVAEAIDRSSHEVVARDSAALATDLPSATLEPRIPRPRLWSPDTPVLYTLRASLFADRPEPIDVIEQPVGMRSFEARDGKLLLNGQPLYMRGALDQAYWPDSLYTPPSDAAIEREIRLARSMGLNLLRKHIKPEDPRYLDACDRLGMLVWAEPANPTAYTPAARAALRRDLLEMLERDFNHPSVVIWSLYNEDWGLPGLWSEPDRHAWLRELYHEVRAIDPTRLICDNSGWAHVLTDLNDYHEYFSVPDRATAFRKRLDFIEAQPADNYAQGQAPRGGEPVLVSEWGNWSLTDPRHARENNGGIEPAWFAYDRGYARARGLPPATAENPRTERIKTVTGFERRFHDLGLDDVFGTPAALAEHVQQRAFRSLKAQIEEMRRRPAIQGWVVTELTDVEWEANGWLDYWRQPKTFTSRLAELNADLALVAIPEQPCVWGGEPVVVPVWLSNFTSAGVRGTIRWRVEGTRLAGEVPAAVDPCQTVANPSAIRFWAPDDRPANVGLLVELVQNSQVLARTQAELAWAPRSTGLVSGIALNAHTVERLLRQRLEKQGYSVARSFQPELGLAISPAVTEDLLTFVLGGGRVLWLAQEPGPMADHLDLRFLGLPPGESWRMAGGCAWARAERLAPAPILSTLGWEVADIFPSQAIAAECRQADDDQLAGWFEGWLANAGVFVLRRRVGRGQMLVTTFRLSSAYGLNPVATLLLNRLVELVREY